MAGDQEGQNANAPQSVVTKILYSQVIGSPGTFELDTDIRIFLSRLRNFFGANSITDETKKKAILLSSLSEDSHKLLYSICLPADPNDLSFKTLSGLLSDHFEPKKSYFAARYLFYQVRKSNVESVAQWDARLRDLASRCKFGSELDIVIRDIFMVGMGTGKIQDRLLEEDASNAAVTLAELIEVATNRETTANTSKQWVAKGSLVTVNFTKPTQSKAKRSYQQTHQGREGNTYNASDKRKCQFCGRTNHTSSVCKYKSYSCNTCGTFSTNV